MRKVIICLYLIISTSVLCFAQSALWAGNAARGNDDAYPASIRSSGKAAGMSLALPEGTLVQVRNQKNNLTVDVTIVSGQGKPGIFLLLNSTAADALEIHTGEVIMVEIQEKSSVSNPFLDYSADPDSFKKNLNEEFLAQSSDDPDNAAAVDVGEEMGKMGYAAAEEEGVPEEEPALETATEASVAAEPVITEDVEVEPEPEPVEADVAPEPVEPEPEIVIPAAEDGRDYEEIIIADSEETFDDVLDYGEEAGGEDILIPADTAAAEEEAEPFLADEISGEDMAAVTEDIPAVEPAPVTDEEDIPEADTALEEEAAVVDPDRVIYFLTPAELRPPEPVEEAPAIPEWGEAEDDLLVAEAVPEESAEGVSEPEKEEPSVIFVPQYVDGDELDAYMKETLETGARYVQVATAGKNEQEHIYKNMEDLQESFPYLPILLLPGKDENSLRLMVGPVSRDEVGILLYAMKAHGFSDAFLNRE